jgi:hypothetical protein
MELPMNHSRRAREEHSGVPRWITGIMLFLAVAAIGLAFLDLRWSAGPMDSTQTLGTAPADPHRRTTVHDFAGPSTLTTPNASGYAPDPSDGPATPTTPKGR